MKSDIIQIQFEFGKNLLGPVLAEYLQKLYAHIRFFQDERNAKVLFVSRAGIRIRRALDVFVSSMEYEKLEDVDYFWISRLMVAKGTWNRNQENSIKLLKQEFEYSTIKDFVEAMYRQHGGLPEGFPVDDSRLSWPGKKLEAFLKSNDGAAYSVKNYFVEQSRFFEEYLESIVGDKATVLLIDTGWAGTAQRLLADAYKEIDWWGAYFGRYGFENTNRKYWWKMFGLVFDKDEYDFHKPETSIVLHRHLIEDLFEPSGPSIECLLKHPEKGVYAPVSEKLLKDQPTPESDPFYCGAVEYLKELPDGRSLAALHRAARKAWHELARIIALPKKEEALLFSNVMRSADFGKTLKVPVLLPPQDRFEGDSPERRINDSLWPTGQAAIEYPSDVADPIQRRIAGLDLWAFKRPKNRPLPRVYYNRSPLVAVITRTLDRPLFLRRAIQSVAEQTFTDYVHVIVNDGGDVDLVKKTIKEETCRHHQIIVVDNVINRGMEAASNIGINSVDSKYIVIHDDDDTWHPDFLKKTVQFLEGEKGKVYGGVITKSYYISEKVTPEGIKILGSRPYQDWVQNVNIMEMAMQNFFPPIAFLFKREIYKRIGGYNESFPVLGDWDFNLRFLLEADIAVIPEFLANYHHRDAGDIHTFGNSVIAGHQKHVEYAAIVRNEFVRNVIRKKHQALSVMVGMGLHLDAMRQNLRNVEQNINNFHFENREKQVTTKEILGAGDDIWVAFTRLVQALEINDPAILKKYPFGRRSLLFGGLLRKGKRPTLSEADAWSLMDDLLKLHDENYPLISPPDFDEDVYLKTNKDVAQSVEKGEIRTGFEHYYRWGRQEGRPRPFKKRR